VAYSQSRLPAEERVRGVADERCMMLIVRHHQLCDLGDGASLDSCSEIQESGGSRLQAGNLFLSSEWDTIVGSFGGRHREYALSKQSQV